MYYLHTDAQYAKSIHVARRIVYKDWPKYTNREEWPVNWVLRRLDRRQEVSSRYGWFRG